MVSFSQFITFGRNAVTYKKQDASKLRWKYPKISLSQQATGERAGWPSCPYRILALSVQNPGQTSAALPECFRCWLCQWPSSCLTQLLLPPRIPTGHLGRVKVAVRAITGICTGFWGRLPPPPHWYNHFVFYLSSQPSSSSMAESQKITLIMEKSPVPFSCQSKMHGVKFPLNTRETHIYPQA